MDKLQLINNSIRGITKIGWKDLYDSEEELINDLQKIDIVKYKNHLHCKGYQYIETFQKQQELTQKQLTQLKRLAKWIKLYVLENNMD